MRATPTVLSAAVILGLACAATDRPQAPAADAATASSPAAAARRVVESFHAVLLAGMKQADLLGFEGRYLLIAAGQAETFDVPSMAHASVLRGWKRLSEGDRSRWVDLAREYWASRHAHEYSSYSGQRFETLGVEPAAADGLVVHARLVRPGGDDVDLDYRLAQTDGGWRIVELGNAGEPGEVRRLREFNYAVLERRGFEALVSEIEQDIAGFRRE